MKILVTVKRVPDPEQKVKIKDGAFDLSGINYIVNPFDEYAVEAALRLLERAGARADGHEVVVLSIAGPEGTQQLRSCLAMGADRGILVEGNDESLDSEQVARIVCAVYQRESPDLLLMGKQAVDGDSNQAGQLAAGYLGLPQACFACEIDMAADSQSLTVGREIDGGTEFKRVPLPAVVTVDLRIVLPQAVAIDGQAHEYPEGPRYASLKGIMQAKRKKIEQLNISDLGLEQHAFVKTLSVEAPAARQAGVIVSSVEELVDKLHNEAKAL